jgi:hypothetical protein
MHLIYYLYTSAPVCMYVHTSMISIYLGLHLRVLIGR